MHKANIKGQVVEYAHLQKGDRTLLCFNGYGKLAKDFKVFLPYLEGYSVFCVHLPLHGESAFSLQGKDPVAFFSALFSIMGLSNTNMDLLAYSIGARYVYLLKALFPNKWQKLVLLAPDGIVPSPVSNFATFNPLGKVLMRAFIKNGGIVVFLLKLLQKLDVMRAEDIAFFLRKINTEKDRKTLMLVWKEVYTTTPSFLDTQIGKDHSCTLVLGKEDKIFPMDKIKKRLRNRGKVQFVECLSTHAMLNTEVGKSLGVAFSI